MPKKTTDEHLLALAQERSRMHAALRELDELHLVIHKTQPTRHVERCMEIVKGLRSSLQSMEDD